MALSRVRLRGAVFLRAEYTESWAYVSVGPEDMAVLLSPGSPRAWRDQHGASASRPNPPAASVPG